MITKIQFGENTNKSLKSVAPPHVSSLMTIPQTNNETKSIDSDVLKNYFITFTGKTVIDRNVNKKTIIEDNLTPSAEKLIENARKIAIDNKNPEINNLHIIKAGINYLNNYISELDTGKRLYSDTTTFEMPYFFEDMLTIDLFKNKDLRNKLSKTIKQQEQLIDIAIKNQPKHNDENPELSKNLIKDIYSTYIQDAGAEDVGGDERVSDRNIINAAIFPYSEDYDNVLKPFIMELKNSILVDDTPLKNRIHLTIYDEKAKNIWNNLNIGTNMLVLHEKDANPNFMLNSLLYTFDNNKTGFGKLNKENTNITVMTREFDEAFIQGKLKEFGKEPSKNHIIILDITDRELNALHINDEMSEVFLETPNNIKFIFIVDKNTYYTSNSSNDKTQGFYNQLGEISMPLINTAQAKKIFKEEPLLMKKIKKGFSQQAIQKCVELSANLSGNYPEKTQKLMDMISTYYVDKTKEIGINDVLKYYKEAKDLFKTVENDSSVEVIFDTGKKLKDIIGKENTKKEANNIIHQIKTNKLGTKGMIIYSQDGSIGSGRRHTAEVIAGESHSPFISINAIDFGTKDVDLFGGGSMSPEASIKKLFSLVTAQAEANQNKSAVLYAENFEYFSVGELVSEYHQKAMAQLLREMDSCEKKGLNILVIGSVGNPDLIGESTMKSFKFTDNIEVSSPATNNQSRFDILNNTIKKFHIALEGNIEEQDSLLNYISLITEGFAFIELKNFVKKAESVAIERGHKKVTKADFSESYLRMTTGRTSGLQLEPFGKELVTAHECGHAVSLQVMNDLAKNLGKPWHIPEQVTFITLDSRGGYGAAVYTEKDSNSEHTFENKFASIVCSYGGHACEKHFYDMDGSWGISSDLNHVTKTAEYMVKIMGMGHNTGKISFINVENGNSNSAILTNNMLNNIEKDMSTITKNALNITYNIVDVYSDFIKEFTGKYSPRVNTGECLIDGDTFREEFHSWKKQQSAEKQAEFKLLDNLIIESMAKTKKGEIY